MLEILGTNLQTDVLAAASLLKVTSDRNANFEKLQAETKPDPEHVPADVRGGKDLEVDI